MAKNDTNDKKDKKKKGKVPVFLIILFLLLAALFLLMQWLGLGFGGGKGEGGSGNGNESVAATADDSNNATEKTNIKIEVKGSTYVYDGSEHTLDELKTKLSELDKDTSVVEFVDNGAVENAMADAKAAAADAGVSVVTSDSAAADSEE